MLLLDHLCHCSVLCLYLWNMKGVKGCGRRITVQDDGHSELDRQDVGNFPGVGLHWSSVLECAFSQAGPVSLERKLSSPLSPYPACQQLQGSVSSLTLVPGLAHIFTSLLCPESMFSSTGPPRGLADCPTGCKSFHMNPQSGGDQRLATRTSV